MSALLPSPLTPLAIASIGLLALQVSLLVLTSGIFVTTMISANATLAILRRTVSDITSLARRLEDGAGGKDTRPSI